MKRILITGGNGYIAKNIYESLNHAYKIDVITRANFDLLDTVLVKQFFSDKFYDAVIHTAIIGGSRLKEDSTSIVYDNTLMLYNILDNKKHYKRLINLGSGAELAYPKTPYGMSKNIISNIINSLDNHYNIRIFAVFNENELETRFIKSNLQRYINREAIIIHENKFMDFFYMNDLIAVVKHYIDTDSAKLPKLSECTYDQKYTLYDIASIINTLSDYKVPIKISNTTQGSPYIGQFAPNLNLIGLEGGIKKTYDYLFKKHAINCVEFY